jgi:hypothetical protein
MSGSFVVARSELSGAEWPRCVRTRAALQTLGVAFDALECSEQHACRLRNGEVACFGSNTWFQSAPTAPRVPRLTIVARHGAIE